MEACILLNIPRVQGTSNQVLTQNIKPFPSYLLTGEQGEKGLPLYNGAWSICSPDCLQYAMQSGWEWISQVNLFNQLLGKTGDMKQKEQDFKSSVKITTWQQILPNGISIRYSLSLIIFEDKSVHNSLHFGCSFLFFIHVQLMLVPP